jgi:hypothetical protein
MLNTIKQFYVDQKTELNQKTHKISIGDLWLDTHCLIGSTEQTQTAFTLRPAKCRVRDEAPNLVPRV